MIFDMESDMHDMIGLATAVRIMGERTGSQAIEARAVAAVGTALETVADRLLDAWRDAFKLSHPET